MIEKMRNVGVLILVSGVTLVTGGVARAQVTHIDPAGGYTQVVTVEDRGVKTVYVSGQVGEGADLEEHTRSAFQRLVGRLAQAGATVDDVVKIRIFVKDLVPDDYRIVAAVRRETFNEDIWPASTVASVEALARDGFRVEVEAVAVVATDGTELLVERFGPSNGFSAAVAVTAHGVKTIYVAGQVGQGDDLVTQTGAVWERVGQRLAAAGASFGDLVKTTTYIVGFDPSADLAAYRAGRPAGMNLDEPPASTLLGVPGLVNDRFQIEIDAVAVVATDGASLEREHIDPAGSFTQVVTARGTGPTTVYVSGQVGTPGDPLAEQADQAYANLKRRLAAAGALPMDLLKVTVYVPNYTEDVLAVLGPAREKHGFTTNAPASTLLGIQSLYSTEAGIEVEGVAVVGTGH